MKRFIFSIFFVIFPLLGTFSAAAAEPDGIPFSQVELLRPKAQGWDVLSVAERGDDDFAPVPDGLVTLSRFEESLWLRLPLKDVHAHLQKHENDHPCPNATLLLSSMSLSQVNCFLSKGNGKYARFTHGSDTFMDKRSVYSRYPAFLLHNLPKEGYIYLNVQAKFPLQFRFYLLNEHSYLNFFLKNLFFHVTLFGCLFALIVAYAFFYRMTKNGLYLVAMLNQLGMCFLLAALSGYMQYFFNSPPSFLNLAAWLSCAVVTITNVLFCRMTTSRPIAYGALNKTISLLLSAQFFLNVLMLFLSVLNHTAWAVKILAFTLLLVVWADIVTVASRIKEKAPRCHIVLFVLSRLSFMTGLIGAVLYALFPSLFPNAETAMLCFPLSSMLLSCMLAQETRMRLQNYDSLEEQKTHYKELSQVDRMTGIANKAHMLRLLEGNICAAESSGKHLSFIMLDIDHFKRFNDTWGHQEGDRALAFVAQIVCQNLRGTDLAARYGGEEFSVILAGAPLPTAILVAERIRKTCETETRKPNNGKFITLSLGISTLRPGDTPQTLIQRADEALYRAKNNGRNRIEVDLE